MFSGTLFKFYLQNSVTFHFCFITKTKFFVFNFKIPQLRLFTSALHLVLEAVFHQQVKWYAINIFTTLKFWYFDINALWQSLFFFILKKYCFLIFIVCNCSLRSHLDSMFLGYTLFSLEFGNASEFSFRKMKWYRTYC